MICNAVANMLMVKGGKTKIENMASIVDGFMWRFNNQKPTRPDLTLYFGEELLLLDYASCYASIQLRQVLVFFFLPSQIVTSVESSGLNFFASSWSSSKCTEMHTSQTHTIPNRSRLRLTGIGAMDLPYHEALCLFDSSSLWRPASASLEKGNMQRNILYTQRHHRHVDK